VHTAPVLLALVAACAEPTRVAADAPAPAPPAPDDVVETVPSVVADSGETAEPAAPEHLPVLRIAATGPIVDGEKVDATLQIVEDYDGTPEGLAAAPLAFEGPIGIEIHGSSSTGYPKLGYRFECRDDDSTDGNCALVGLPEGSDWVLSAPYADKTYLRNALGYRLGRAAAADRGAWEPSTRFVELFLDGQYVGIYVLVERVSQERARLDFPDTTDPEDGSVDGGFLVKVDQHRSAGFDTARGTPIDWSEPKSGEVTEAEAAYLLDWFDRAETALLADGWDDPTTGYPAWLDVDGWVDHWLVNELANNIDAYRLSAYLWADGPPGQHLLHAGPLWDFDRAFGNVNYCYTWQTEGWVYDALDACGYAYQYPFWWERLREDPAFLDRLATRWAELRAGAFSDDALVAALAEMQAEVAEAERRDHARWPVVGVWVDPNWYVGATWQEDVDWLRDWTLARAAWMDAHVGEP
jgi:hypothetical protein